MKIRKATIKDKKEFLATQKEAFPNLNLKKQARYFDLKMKNKEIFCLSENKDYVGHLCFGKHLLTPPFAKSVFMEELAIKNKFRGKGFGTFLIKFLINYCKKNKIDIVYTSTGNYTNNKSTSFYKRLGFEKVGSLKDIDPKSEYDYGQIFLGKLLK